MSNIRQWLEELGLAQYADAFEENDIDREVLPHLTDAFLKEIGVASVGHRVKFLTAIEGLGGQDIPGVEKEFVSPAPEAAAVPTARGAERRQLTVMFCDLVGSTALSEQLDPEDLRKVMAAYQKTAGAVIERYEGHVAQYLGDGLMIYFGWPRAHEEDAERAVRAGLGIVEAVKAVEAPEPLRVRVGIATGPVVVGETGAGDASVPKVAVGETPNLAARIEGLAEPDTVLVGDSTRRLIAGSFEFDDLGKKPLKGIGGGTAIYRVRGESKAESRFEAAHTAGMTAFVGREDEVGMFVNRWSQAKDGDGQVVLLCGEPGIGKSRITQELRERLAGEPHTRLRYQCSPYYTNSAFYPMIEQVERAAGFTKDDAPEQKLDKLEEALAPGTENVAEIAPLIGAMMSLSIERYAPLDLSPQRQKEKTIEALAGLVVGLARHDPVLMIFEDAHWIDPTTMEVLASIIDRIQNHPVLLVITYRPEFEPPWSGYGHVTVHTLNRFSRRLGGAMVANVTGGKSLPDEVLEQIVAKTDGVPLFLEELTKTVLESGVVTATERGYALSEAVAALAIPTTLQDSLIARLDRLATGKELAQIGACIGREFSHDLLAAIAGMTEERLNDSLRQLKEAGLIFPRGVAPRPVYVFKHALVQDTAYASLLRGRRQQLHGLIAETLERQYPSVKEQQPELLAHHFAAAELAEPASRYWLLAGRLAAERSASLEAERHLRAGLALIDKLPEIEASRRRKLDYLSTLAVVLRVSHGYGHPDLYETYTQARDLSRALGDIQKLFQIQFGLWTYTIGRGDYARCFALGDECLSIAQDMNDNDYLLEAHRLNGGTRAYFGDHAIARGHLQTAIGLYDPERHHQEAQLYGLDPLVISLGYLSWAMWHLGYPDTALAHSERSMQEPINKIHVPSRLIAYVYAAMLLGFRREPDATLQLTSRATGEAEESGYRGMEVWLRIFNGWARSLLGEGDAAISEIRDAISKYRDLWGEFGVPTYLTFLADALRTAGDLVGAAEALDEAGAVMKRTGEHMMAPECARLMGDLALAEGKLEEAARQYRNAVDSARRDQSLSLELRAAVSLARLWRDRGKSAEAGDMLDTIYGRFAEGHGTADLKDAKALLDKLK